MSDSLLNLIPRIVADQSDFIIGWRDATQITRNEFLKRVSSWQILLAQLPGQNYALYLDDSIEFSAALFGAWHAGKTVWLAADTLTATSDALKLSVDGFLGNFPEDCSPIVVIPAGLGGNPVALVDVPKVLKYEPLDNQFIGLVVHTSGTTGVAQAIPKKMSQLAIEIATLEQLFGEQSAKAEIISTVTHQHIYGLLFKVLWPLTAHRAIHARTQLYPEELAQLISTRSSILISSPAHLKRLPTHLNWNTSNLCAIFSSGGVLSSDVAQSTSTLLGQNPIEIFGSSETGGIAWRQRCLQEDESWIPMPNVQWRSASDQESIEIRSPHLLTEEWFQLADRIQAKNNGRFILQGRRDRIVKIEEKRISLDLIEQKMATSPLVSEVKIIAFGEEQGAASRQYVAAVIVLSASGKSVLDKAGKLALNKQLKNVLVNYVEPVAVPRKWRYVDQIPVNGQGKTPQTMLRDLFIQAPEHSEEKTTSPIIKLLKHDKNCVEFELIWPSNLLYFEGHFRETPILPGIAQVDWAIKTGRQYFDLASPFRAMHALKFQHVILPENLVHLKLEYDQNKACLSFSYFSSTKQHSSGRVLFDPYT
jgi:acyl-coenzyme A synthetase/AMP-(fatty) acid ligase